MSPRLQSTIFLITIALISGCSSVGPDYNRPNNLLPEKFTVSGKNDSGPDQILAAFIPTAWWEHYQDPILNNLITSALQNNTDIKIAVARVEEADGHLREVGAALFPSIDLRSNALRSRISKVSVIPVFPGLNAVRQIYNVSLGTAFELDFWGKVRRAKEAAQAEALATYYARDTVYLSIAGLVATNYLLLRSLDAQLFVSRNTLRNRDDSLKITKRRLEIGIISALDVHQSEIANSNLTAQIAEIIRQRSISEHQLAVLTGVLDLRLAEGDIKTLPIPPIPPEGLPSSLLEARPDIREAEEQVIATNANIGVAKAALFPSIMLTSSFGTESITLGNLIKSAANIWTAGLSFNMPIFNAGRLLARLDQVNAQQKQALASYEGSIRTAFREVNDALINVRQGNERENTLQISEQFAKKALEVAENRYKHGYSAYIEVLDSQRTHNDATLAVIQSRQDRLVATVDLFKALGGGWKYE